MSAKSSSACACQHEARRIVTPRVDLMHSRADIYPLQKHLYTKPRHSTKVMQSCPR